jgi:cyclopropane fatty-acyl-phospholipid synthase-like methyltransferase
LGATDQVASFYDRWSGPFLERFGATFQAGLVVPPGAEPDDRLSTRLLAQRARIEPGDRVLDAGCGIGGPAMAIAEEFDATVDGVTISAEQIALGSRLLADAGLEDRVRLHLADFHELPFEDETFDAVVMFEAVCYTDDLDRLFTELTRVLKPGGRMYVKDIFVREGELSPASEEDMRTYHETWAAIETPTLKATETAIARAGLIGVESSELEDINTDRFFGSMLEPGTLRLDEMGEHFTLYVDEIPIYWAEVLGTKPA